MSIRTTTRSLFICPALQIRGKSEASNHAKITQGNRDMLISKLHGEYIGIRNATGTHNTRTGVRLLHRV